MLDPVEFHQPGGSTTFNRKLISKQGETAVLSSSEVGNYTTICDKWCTTNYGCTLKKCLTVKAHVFWRNHSKRAIDDHRHLLQTMSLIIHVPCIVFALIITINILCTGIQKARVFAMPLPRIGVVELNNAPYPKHVPFTCASALTNSAVTAAVQPAIGYQYKPHSREW